MDTRDGALFKCTSALQTDVDCLIPAFINDSLDILYLEYQLVALQCHMGGDRHGHYRTALRVLPSAVEWLLCDDDQTPHPCWQLPEWFVQNVTLAWMVRTDLLNLHQYANLPPPTTVAQDMLNLLQRRDDPET